ncbi:hypothetical protein IFM89_002095 [Coptis chinensis]|uniref:DUF868 domain-containing protein n=1 Tax=Coptis chinensis TaxID=261450 RepID=A0A835H0P3_9MAGN|nr:hypothetical protein IFM89_002095 [Coptis chinensis]
MRDIASCFSEYSVTVSDASCSSASNLVCRRPGQAFRHPNLIPSIQNAVTCIYKANLSTQKQILISVTWCRNHIGQGLSIKVGDELSSTIKVNMDYRLFRRKKGNRTFESGNSTVEVLWDLSMARYDLGPEPTDGFYVAVMVDAELGLLLGSMGEELATKKFMTGVSIAKFSLVSRREHYYGNTLYCTKAQFCDTGTSHDILIRCSGEEYEGLKGPVLSVCVDKKKVILVRKLQWNFRGNRTIFVDGLLIDMMWDVHDWFFNPASGYAVFMFRTRSGLDSRLWLEEKVLQKEQDRVDQFSFLIYASKSP